MTPAPILVIRPRTSLGVSQLVLLARTAAGAETELLRRPGSDHAAVTAELERRLATGGSAAPGLLVDLEACAWVDSGTLGVWVSWHHALAARGGRVAVCRANARIRNILAISQLDQLFPVCATLADGEAALGRAEPS